MRWTMSNERGTTYRLVKKRGEVEFKVSMVMCKDIKKERAGQQT